MPGAATDSQPLLPGSQRELGELYAAHNGWLNHWLQGRLRCPQDAADLSQDTFLRLILGEQSLEALRDPRAYLMVIASRLMINRHHRRQVEEEALRQVAILVETRDDRGPAEIAAAHDLLVTVLRLLVDELPEKPRRAFLLARLEGLTYRQIARRLSVSESSVKQYLAKAFAHCHARLYDSLAEAPCPS